MFVVPCYSDEVRSLSGSLEMVRGNLAETTKVVSETVSHVNRAYNDTLAIYLDVYDLLLPEVNAQDIKERAQSIADEVRHSSSFFWTFYIFGISLGYIIKDIIFPTELNCVYFWLKLLWT